MISIEHARKWYQSADAVHNFEHILRVLKMAEYLGKQEGADLDIVRASVLLHDAEGSNPADIKSRADHHEISAEFAKEILVKEKWDEDKIAAVQHCIRAHRFRSTERPNSIEAKVVFDADKIDAIGAVGAARAIAYSALANKPFFSPPSDKFLKSFELEDNEEHSAYHEFVFKLTNIKDRLYTDAAKKIATARHEYLLEFFNQLESEYLGEK